MSLKKRFFFDFSGTPTLPSLDAVGFLSGWFFGACEVVSKGSSDSSLTACLGEELGYFSNFSSSGLISLSVFSICDFIDRSSNTFISFVSFRFVSFRFISFHFISFHFTQERAARARTVRRETRHTSVAQLSAFGCVFISSPDAGSGAIFISEWPWASHSSSHVGGMSGHTLKSPVVSVRACWWLSLVWLGAGASGGCAPGVGASRWLVGLGFLFRFPLRVCRPQFCPWFRSRFGGVQLRKKKGHRPQNWQLLF